MCTLAIYRDVSESFPLVVAANRDEFLDRPATGPRRWTEAPAIVAGRDQEGGGTWLGCRVDGPPLVAGLLNRRPGPTERAASSGELSRGLLCIEALGEPTSDAAERSVCDRDVSRYAGFNLLLADRKRAVVIDNRAGPVTTELAGGLSVLTNLEVNDPRCARLASAVPEFERLVPVVRAAESPDALVERLASVLGDHRNTVDPANVDPLARLCVHTNQGYGTRSATVIVCDRLGAVYYFHAAGPPCTTAFVPVSY